MVQLFLSAGDERGNVRMGQPTLGVRRERYESRLLCGCVRDHAAECINERVKKGLASSPEACWENP